MTYRSNSPARSRQSRLQDESRAALVVITFIALWYLILLGLAATVLVIAVRYAF